MVKAHRGAPRGPFSARAAATASSPASPSRMGEAASGAWAVQTAWRVMLLSRATTSSAARTVPSSSVQPPKSKNTRDGVGSSPQVSPFRKVRLSSSRTPPAGSKNTRWQP